MPISRSVKAFSVLTALALIPAILVYTFKIQFDGFTKVLGDPFFIFRLEPPKMLAATSGILVVFVLLILYQLFGDRLSPRMEKRLFAAAIVLVLVWPFIVFGVHGLVYPYRGD